MSVRSLSPLALAVGLLAGAVGGAAAQEGGTPKMPPPTPPGPVAQAAPETRIVVPQLGPIELDFDIGFPAVNGPFEHRQIFNFTTGQFGGQGSAGPTRIREFGNCRVGAFVGSEEWAPAECRGAVADPFAGLCRTPGRAPMSRDTSCGMGSYCAPPLPKLAAPAPADIVKRVQLASPGQYLIGRDGAHIRLFAANDDVLMTPPTCPPCPLPKVAVNPLLGTWYRELPALNMVVAVTFTHDELKLSVAQVAHGHTAVATATAHYAVSADGLVYGAVTGADVDVKNDPKAGPPSMDLAELLLTAQSLVEVPFSCRTKATSAGLMVSGVKCGMPAGVNESEQLQAVFGGLFKHAKDGKAPAPTAGTGSGIRTGAKCDCGYDPRNWPAPAGAPVERVGIDFSTNPPQMVPPAPPVACPTPPAGAEQFGPPFLSKIPYLNRLYQNAAPAPCPQPSFGCGTQQLAAEAFQQMLQQSPLPPPPPAGGMTLPSPQYLQHYPQHFAPDPAFPLPRELACQEGSAVRPVGAVVSTPAKAVAVGTWVREVANKQCVLKVEPGHLTLTVHDAHEINGKVSTATLTITADYHMARDGVTAVGLITGVDVCFDGELPAEDPKPFFDMLGELQKALEDKPFALTFRSYGDALVIGNVRMPQVANHLDVQPAGYMAGRYKPAGDKLPKPKVTKVPAELRAPRVSDLPAGPYISPVPTGAPRIQPTTVGDTPLPPSCPNAPNGDLLPPQRIPPAAQVIPSVRLEDRVPQPTAEPTRPCPQMPQPAKPGDVVPVSLGRGRWNSDTTFATDPNSRIQQLLHGQEEVLGNIHREWRRFWFDDQPSHLTPERIHGGIY